VGVVREPFLSFLQAFEMTGNGVSMQGFVRDIIAWGDLAGLGDKIFHHRGCREHRENKKFLFTA
jgi:hypothetical protein